MQTIQTTQIKFVDGRWYILNVGPYPIPSDTALVDVTSMANGVIEGRIVAVHGLHQNDAEHLTKAGLSAVGATGPASRKVHTPKSRRGQLGPNGRVEWMK
jgi:hypothetical protein